MAFVGAEQVQIRNRSVLLDADLYVTHAATGLVIFAHGSGSSRFSRRNRHVADLLHSAGYATLLLDLLTKDEESLDERTGEFRFDIDLLGRRVVAAIDAAGKWESVRGLPIGLFGASTGAAAALVAAAERQDQVRAVVSRGGRPDLAGPALRSVRAPTLLIVGGLDEPVIELNEEARRTMGTEVRVEIVPGATHLFEEPGALETVANLASAWFDAHLTLGGQSILDGMAPGEE